MRVVNIQRMSLDDGPGIRTTVFVKGCPLRCRWCHNPECISLQESPEFLQSFPDSFVFDGNVEAFCDLICRDMDFFRKSGGGITFSGGEPLMHADIIAECMANVKGRGCHTALDTCGLADWRAFEKVLDLTDLVLFDLKAASSRLHQRLTGADNALIWENFFRLLEAGQKVWVRIPSIGHANDGELEQIAEKIPASEHIERVEFLPYHRYGIAKYAKLNLGYTGDDFTEPKEEYLQAAVKILRQKGLACYRSGARCDD